MMMKIANLSTLSFMRAPGAGVRQTQAELARLQGELSTGRVADTGLALGAGAARLSTSLADRLRLQTIGQSNSLASARMEASTQAMGQIASLADKLMTTLVAARQDKNATAPLTQQAQADLKTVLSALNASANGEYLFAGVNTDVKPMTDFAAGSPARAAFDAAHQAAFGAAPGDPAMASVSGAAMDSFLDGAFASLFDAAGWSGAWSSASAAVKTRISLTERIETSVSANDESFRQVTQAFVMVADGGLTGLNDDARNAVVSHAINVLGKGIAGLAAAQAKLGAAQSQTDAATQRLSVQADALTRFEDQQTGVDQYAASVHINQLTTRLDASYALTSRLSNLSLLKYL